MDKQKTYRSQNKEPGEIKMPPKVSKEIAKDVWLFKEPETINSELYYKFTVKAKTVKIVLF